MPIREKTILVTIAATGVPQQVTTDSTIWTPKIHFERQSTAAAAIGVGGAEMTSLATARYTLTSTWPVRDPEMADADAENGQMFRLADYWAVGTLGDVMAVTIQERY